MIRTILALCSRDSSHEGMRCQLRRLLDNFLAQEGSWHDLITEAEQNGIASLLHKHLDTLDITLPDSPRRQLQSLYLRNKRSNNINNQAVAEILSHCREERVDILTVKGIALSNFVYSDNGLRPMRDIDLLVSKKDMPKALLILKDLGYEQEQGHDIPPDYYHAPPMVKSINGLPVGIELHHNLLPFHGQYPLWPLEKSIATARELTINGVKALTLNLEETLWYVYLHGLQAPITYEYFRFIHISDLATIVEKYLHEIDWDKINKELHTFCNILSRVHFLTPWTTMVLKRLSLDISRIPEGIGQPYRGWPKHRLHTVTMADILPLTRETLWPAEWWVQIYYGHLTGYPYWKSRLVRHPRMLWQWVKAYLHKFRTTGKW